MSTRVLGSEALGPRHGRQGWGGWESIEHNPSQGWSGSPTCLQPQRQEKKSSATYSCELGLVNLPMFLLPHVQNGDARSVSFLVLQEPKKFIIVKNLGKVPGTW